MWRKISECNKTQVRILEAGADLEINIETMHRLAFLVMWKYIRFNYPCHIFRERLHVWRPQGVGNVRRWGHDRPPNAPQGVLLLPARETPERRRALQPQLCCSAGRSSLYTALESVEFFSEIMCIVSSTSLATAINFQTVLYLYKDVMLYITLIYFSCDDWRDDSMSHTKTCFTVFIFCLLACACVCLYVYIN